MNNTERSSFMHVHNFGLVFFWYRWKNDKEKVESYWIKLDCNVNVQWHLDEI